LNSIVGAPIFALPVLGRTALNLSDKIREIFQLDR
jgi:hypothetical protein